MHLTVVNDPPALAQRGAQLVADALAVALQDVPRCSLALSGGSTPAATLEMLAGHDEIEWHRVDVYQVDERVAPAGHPDRNSTMLRSTLLDRIDAVFHPMDVDSSDLDRAVDAYEAGLPDTLDVVVLGLGDDGHTASLVAGDAALDVTDRAVARTGEHRGYTRLTLTLPVLDRAALLVWLISGESKQCALAQMLSGDPTIPAARVRSARAHVLVDRAAADREGC